MGWGSGAGKGKILAPAAGDLVHVSVRNPFDSRMVLTDISGLAHRASKKQPKQVAQEATLLLAILSLGDSVESPASADDRSTLPVV